MNVRGYRNSDLESLYQFWTSVGEEIPYFFPVSVERWRACLLEDTLEGQALFRTLQTDLATRNGQVLGFVQYGEPSFAWDERGERYEDPQIGVVRQLYFAEGRDDVGEALLGRAQSSLARFEQTHAFYHILGMSCTARHGKLHQSQGHVHGLLQRRGLRVEYENVYLVLDMLAAQPKEGSPGRLQNVDGSRGERFEMWRGGEVVATARVGYLDRLTEGRTSDTVYLYWIGVVPPLRGQGIGGQFLMLLAAWLVTKGYRYLHTDTARKNVGAQRFYKTLGFVRAGVTRSYMRSRGSAGA